MLQCADQWTRIIGRQALGLPILLITHTVDSTNYQVPNEGDLSVFNCNFSLLITGHDDSSGKHTFHYSRYNPSLMSIFNRLNNSFRVAWRNDFSWGEGWKNLTVLHRGVS